MLINAKIKSIYYRKQGTFKADDFDITLENCTALNLTNPKATPSAKYDVDIDINEYKNMLRFEADIKQNLAQFSEYVNRKDKLIFYGEVSKVMTINNDGNIVNEVYVETKFGSFEDTILLDLPEEYIRHFSSSSKIVIYGNIEGYTATNGKFEDFIIKCHDIIYWE